MTKVQLDHPRQSAKKPLKKPSVLSARLKDWQPFSVQYDRHAAAAISCNRLQTEHYLAYNMDRIAATEPAFAWTVGCIDEGFGGACKQRTCDTSQLTTVPQFTPCFSMIVQVLAMLVSLSLAKVQALTPSTKPRK